MIAKIIKDCITSYKFLVVSCIKRLILKKKTLKFLLLSIETFFFPINSKDVNKTVLKIPFKLEIQQFVIDICLD